MPQRNGQVKREPVAGYLQHPYLYFPDTSMTLKAQNPEQLFRIHGYLFERESDEARALLAQLNEEPVGIIELEGVDSEELVDFLKVLYTPPLQEPEIEGSASWTHVLKLSTLWNFAHLRTHAISRLLHLVTKSIHRVHLAHQYNVEEWLRNGYLRLCEREKLPKDQDIERLGHDVFVKMVRVRERLAKSQDTLSRPEKIHLIEEAFGLEHIPYVDDPLDRQPIDVDAPLDIVMNEPASVSVKSNKRPRPSSTTIEEPSEIKVIHSGVSTPKGQLSYPNKKKKGVQPAVATKGTHAQVSIAQSHHYEEQEWPEYAPGEDTYYEPQSHPHVHRGRGTGQGRSRGRGAGRGRGSTHVHMLPPKPIATLSNPPPHAPRGGASTRGRGRGGPGPRARPYRGHHS